MDTVTLEGVLRQVNQLPPADRQKLREMLDDSFDAPAGRELDKRVAPLIPDYDGDREMRWLAEHRREYTGKWVAVKEDKLVAVGESATEVYAAADAAGAVLPLVTFVEDPDAPPFAGV
jgi:uncharacterized protein DUF5678